MRHSLSSSPTARVAAWLVLLVMCLGLHRSLVVCSGHPCGGKIEWAHASGDCHDHCCTVGDARATTVVEHGGERDAGGERVVPGPGCSDVALGVDSGPLPKPLRFELVPPLCVGLAFCGGVGLGQGEPVPGHKATGPPRCDRRTTLKATTTLLL